MSDIHVFYVSAGLLTSQHRNRIGESLWEFLWLISHETKMEGKVLNGSPITLQRIAEELGESYRTAQRNLERLTKAGYVLKTREHSGQMYCYSIAHSKKWRQFVAPDINVRADINDHSSTVELMTKVSGTPDINVRAYKDSRYVDRPYISATICRKCGGSGMYAELVPSKYEDQQTERWVACDECSHKERPNPR